MSTYIDFRAVAEELLGAYPASNVYFLLDHGGLPGLRKQLLSGSAEWVSLFDGTKEADALAVAPILVLAGRSGSLQASRSIFEWIGKHGTYTSSVMVLASPLQIEILRSRLAARLSVRLVDDMDVMLRFFDPRVFENLTKILSPEQIADFLSIAESWRYVNREGRLISVAPCFTCQDDFSGMLQLSREQENALLEESEIDQVCGFLGKNLPQLMQKLAAAKRYKLITSVVRIARKEGLSSTFKISLCAAIAAAKGEGFVEGQSLERLIVDLKQDNCDFSEALSTLELKGEDADELL